jgi:hypothetical protein
MKGTLHKKENGWQVWYHAKEDLYYGNTEVRILPLHDGDYFEVNRPGQYSEGKEVEFEIVDEIIDLGRHGSTVVEKAKLVDNWSIMKEGDITVNFKPMSEFDEPKYPTKLHQLQIQAAEACFRKYPNNEELYPTDELKDAYKAGVIDGLREWRLDSYNPPTKKQDND